MAKSFVTGWFINSTSVGYSYEHCFGTTDYGVVYLYFIMSLCFLVGTPAHSWCLWLYLRGGWRIKANQMFLVHLIIIELIACVEIAVEVLNEFIFKNYTVFILTYFVYGVSWTGRPLIQTCICIERYVAVIHPVTFLKYKAMKYKLAAVVMVYLISSCYGLYETTSKTVPDPVFNSIYFVVVITVLYCCVSVLCALKKTGPGDKHDNRPTGQEEENQQKKKAFNIIFTTLLVMLFTYIPLLILTACYVINSDRILFYCILGPILGTCSYYSITIAPLLKMYRDGYLKCSNQGN